MVLGLFSAASTLTLCMAVSVDSTSFNLLPPTPGTIMGGCGAITPPTSVMSNHPPPQSPTPVSFRIPGNGPGPIAPHLQHSPAWPPRRGYVVDAVQLDQGRCPGCGRIPELVIEEEGGCS